MSAVRRSLEWYLGLTPPQAGQGTRWRWHLESPLFQSVSEQWTLLALVGAVVAIVYWRGARRVVRRTRMALLGLRLGILLLLAVCAMRISLAVDRTSLPWLAVMIDRSASMDRQDVETGPDAGRVSRLTAIQNWLCDDGQAGALHDLMQHHRLRIFEFSGEAREIGPDAASSADDVCLAIRELKADGLQTRPATSLAAVLGEFRGAPPAAVLVLSDGVSSRGESEKFSAMAQAAHAAAVPIWSVAVGSQNSAADIDLREVLYDRVALAGDVLSFDARGIATGLRGQSVTLHLKSPDGEILDSATTRIADDGLLAATLSHRPEGEGRREYEVAAAPAPEESDLENNVRTVSVQIRNRRIRVLAIERLPRWEFRHLKATLERDEGVSLQTVLLDSDVDYVREDRTALTQPPTEAGDLAQYDAVILGDINPDSLPHGFLEHLKTQVVQGGGLILIAGIRFNPETFSGTPLEGLLPLTPTVGDALTDSTTETLPVVTQAGRSQAFLRLDPEHPEDAVPLPAISWWAGRSSLKPGATVLAEVAPLGGARQPVLVTHRYGAGRVLWQGTDELWKWRRSREDAIYGRYWSQAVRWVSRARLSSDELAGSLRTDRHIYAQGETVQVELTMPDASAPTNAPLRVVLERSPEDRRIVTLEPQPEMPLRFRANVAGLIPGRYRVRQEGATEVGRGDWEFRVESSGAERQGAAADVADLAKISELTRGRSFAWAQADELIATLPPGRPVVTVRGPSVPVWRRWEPAALICGLFSLEWFVRRRQRLV